MIDALKAQVRKLELGEYHQEPKRRRKRIGMRCANFTLNGHYRMAIRSRHSYGGSRSSLQMLALGTVRQVLDKWELLLGANIRAQTIAHHHSFYEYFKFYKRCLLAMPEDTVPELTTWNITKIKSDGTNIPASQQYKAHLVEVTTLFRFHEVPDEWIADGEDAPLLPAQHRHTAWTEIQKIPPSCTGETCRQLILRQIWTLGVGSWTSDCELSSSFCDLPPKVCHIQIFFFASDRGPDQSGCDTILDAELQGSEYKLKFRSWCLEHGLHLEVQDSLKLFPGYFADCAKIANSIRCSSNNTKLRKRYNKLYPGGSADVLFCRLPERPLRIRWGSITLTEAYLLKFEPERFAKAWQETFGVERTRRPRYRNAASKLAAARSKAKQKLNEGKEVKTPKPTTPTTPSPKADDGIDDDTPATYSAKISKWLGDSLVTVHSESYWLSLRAFHMTRAPIDAMRHWNMQKLTQGSQPKFVQLVCHRAQHTSSKWEDLLRSHGDHRSAAEHRFQHIISIEVTALRKKASAQMMLLTLNLAAGFYRRVVLPCSHFPAPLAWVVWEPQTHESDMRKVALPDSDYSQSFVLHAHHALCEPVSFVAKRRRLLSMPLY